MKKIIYLPIYLIVTTTLLVACKQKEWATITPEKKLSILTGLPETFDYTSETGYALIQTAVAVLGYDVVKVEGTPKLPALAPLGKEKQIQMVTDSVEAYTEILPEQYYTISVSIGPSFLCMMYDDMGIPFNPIKNFQLIKPVTDNLMSTGICTLTSKKDMRPEMFYIGIDDFLDLQNTNLCSIIFIEFDKKDHIVSSGKFLFPNFGGIGNIILKKAHTNAKKVYIKAIFEGTFGFFIHQLESEKKFTFI